MGSRNDRRYTKYRKDYCENRDGRLGIVCAWTGPFEKGQLQADHIDGNRFNNDESNIQTLCAMCHTRKTQTNKDYLKNYHNHNKPNKQEKPKMETKMTNDVMQKIIELTSDKLLQIMLSSGSTKAVKLSGSVKNTTKKQPNSDSFAKECREKLEKQYVKNGNKPVTTAQVKKMFGLDESKGVKKQNKTLYYLAKNVNEKMRKMKTKQQNSALL